MRPLLPVLVVPVLLTGCSGPAAAPAATDPPPRPASWSVELGTAPTLVALTPDAALAASYGNGVGGSQVYRVDRGTGELTGQRTVAGQPNGMALAPDGALWLATLRLPDQPTGTGLQVIDPETLLTRRQVPVEGVPLSVAFVGDQLWVGDDTGVQQLDPASGQVLRAVPTAHPAYRLVVAGGGLVVVGREALQRVDPATGEASPPVPLPAAGSAAATGDDEHLWVVHPDAEAASVLARHDPVGLARELVAPSPGRAGAAAALGPDGLWVSDPSGRRLLCLDPATGQVRDQQEVALSGPLAADAESVVVALPGGLAGVPSECGSAD